jgi:uncharacterized protein YceK
MKLKSILSIMFVFIMCVFVSGCSSASQSQAVTSSSGNQTVSSSQSDSSSVSSQAAIGAPLSAKDIVDKLKSAGLPIDNIIVYTEDTDENKLLGRPNQYISKANFADTTVKQDNDKSDPLGGTVETFNNADDLKARKDYCESITKSAAMFAQYYYVNGNYLLRIDHDVSPSNAKKYEKAFSEIK